jgi:hypothetical protein
MSGLFRDPYPRVGDSAIRYAIQLRSHVVRRNRQAFALTPIFAVTLFRQLRTETRWFPPRHISRKNSVTGSIPMKTIIKPRMTFFPSGIMDLGALFSLERAACGGAPVGRPLAPAARLCLAVRRASDL